MSSLEVREEHAAFGGRIGFYTHLSTATGTAMRFAVYLPEGAAARRPPVLYYLAGLTCSEETFFIKAGALAEAARLNLALVACDTSPRGLNLPGDSDDWDFGVGAGFYLDATEPPWSGHYRMGTYINEELPDVVEAMFPVAKCRRGIFGHSMGGHGALVTALRNPARWQSVSALSPIVNPSEVPWGQKAFSRYLGPQSAAWEEWDACALIRRRRYPSVILVDQGTKDQFLPKQLQPEALEEAAAASGQVLRLNRREGYDHSYWFVQTFVGGHITHHAAILHG